MFKSRKQLKREIENLNTLLVEANQRHDRLFQEACEINSNNEQERRELGENIAKIMEDLAESRKIVTSLKGDMTLLTRRIKELESVNATLKSKLSRKHCHPKKETEKK